MTHVNHTSLMTLAAQLRHCCDAQEEVIRGQAHLTPAEYAVLRVFPDGAPLSVAVLANEALLSPSRCSRVVDRLVRRGLVERHESEEDRRVLHLRLSSAGKKLQVTIADCLARCEQRIRGNLSAREARQAEQSLTLLARVMELQ